MSDATTRDMVAGAVRNWADRGWLRRLDAALAAFIGDLCPTADGTVLLAAALVAQVESRGHTCLVLDALLDEPQILLDWPPDAIDALRFVLSRLPDDASGWTAALATCDAVFVATSAADDGSGEPLVLDHGRLYLRRYWRHERRIADQVLSRSASDVALDDRRTRVAIDRLFGPQAGVAPDWQRIAVAVAMRGRFTVVTGGPGTGKTWTAARLLALAFATTPDPSQFRVALAAPTGKAAARLKQSIDAAFAAMSLPDGPATPSLGPARTLHALLGTRRDSRRFRHDAAHPLAFDLVIVDEASMVHVEMMDALLDALPPAASLILLGDKDQLASVEAGAVLGELCADAEAGRYTNDTVAAVRSLVAQEIPDAMRDPRGSALAQRTVMLRRGERFGGAIGALAAAVNAGQGDIADALLDEGGSTLDWTVASSPDDVVGLASGGRAGRGTKAGAQSDGYGEYLAALAGRPDSLFAEDHAAWVLRVLAAFDRFRLLCAVREGPWGVAALNRAVERRLCDDARLVADDVWYVGRPVIVARNDYDVGVFNGDVGVTLPSASNDARLRVHFGGAGEGNAIRSVGVARLADAETAFAMTVHKAQGSEFAHTALVLPPQAGRAVTRELLYTGVTRARERFTLFTPRREIFAEAIAQTTRRSSGIGAMLSSGRASALPARLAASQVEDE